MTLMILRVFKPAMVVVFTVTSMGAVRAQSDAAICASFAPILRQLSVDADQLQERAVAALPDYLELLDPSSPATVVAAHEMAKGLPPAVADQMAEFAVATIRLRAPLVEYNKIVAEALAAAERCAAGT